jgi:glucosylglycerate hydrolase
MEQALPQSTTDSLRAAAVEVLRANDLGGSTKPAPRLYPHQWSWDSAFIAIGLVHVDVERALRELETLFAAQWSDGRVPHIVFNPQAQDYFPGADWWASASTSTAAPRTPATSGLIQPPVHAIALERILETTRSRNLHSLDSRVRNLYERVRAWHQYLVECRDPAGSGLLVIYHPWESGTDNSPRWDANLERIKVGEMPSYQRHDLKHVEDPAERPTHHEYDRYLWLVHLLKQARYADEVVQREYPFQIRDVLMSAIFAAANQSLAHVAELLGRPSSEILELQQWAERSSRAVVDAWDDDVQLALDWDVNVQGAVRVETCAGLAPLIIPNLPAKLLDEVAARAFGAGFSGAQGLAFPVVPSAVHGSPGFNARSYWRGPAWPFFNWLIWWSLQRHGRAERAATLRKANLELLQRPGAQFAEYFDAFTGEPLGSRDQSWTAAVSLDWLAN